MPASNRPQDRDDLHDLLEYIAQSAIDDVSPAGFLLDLQKRAGQFTPPALAGFDDPQGQRAMVGSIARHYWNLTPQPHHGWRPRPLPKPERNGPCPCGSGKKYKQCCQPFEAPEELLPPLNMLKVVIDLMPAAELQDIPLVRLDAGMLAGAAGDWLNEGSQLRSVAVLERLFEDATKVDGRHAECFDLLCDAYFEAGIPTRCAPLIARFVTHPDKFLASTALQQGAGLACDEGDYSVARERFDRAARLTPNDPFLADLEVRMLKAEGRIEEARTRAREWVVRLRRIGHPDFDAMSEALEKMADDPDMELPDPVASELIDDEAWGHLLDGIPEAELLYDIEPIPGTGEAGVRGRPGIEIRPRPELARVEREWRERFAVPKPRLADLDCDSSKACEEFDLVGAFLRDHPVAWHSFDILDDLVLIAGEWFAPDENGWVEGADENDWEEEANDDYGDSEAFDRAAVVIALTGRAVELLEACLASGPGGALLEWRIPAHQPVLRLLAQRIELLLDPLGDEVDAVEIARLEAWMLDLNPGDEFGFRRDLMRNLLRAGDLQRAIDLAGRYPDDIGEMPFDLALALHRAGRPDEAAAAWMRGASATPRIAEALLADDPEPAAAGNASAGLREDHEGPNGAWYAFSYQRAMWLDWEEAGALDWARNLPRAR